MGDPKFPKKTYSTPRHPWQKDRIDAEKEIVNKFGLKNKRELWKGMELLKSFRSQARDLQARMRVQDINAEKQYQALIRRLVRYSILGHNATLDDVLSLTIDDILSRRLQTVVFKKNLARTPKQARQMITHGHVTLNGRRVTVPGLLVEGDLEESIIYHEKSPFTDDLHPMRQVIISGPMGQEEEAEEEGEPEGTENPEANAAPEAKPEGGNKPGASSEPRKTRYAERPQGRTPGRTPGRTQGRPREENKTKKTAKKGDEKQ